jgi:hypothetical protein
MYGWHVMGECEDRQIKYFHTQKNYKNVLHMQRTSSKKERVLKRRF